MLLVMSLNDSSSHPRLSPTPSPGTEAGPWITGHRPPRDGASDLSGLFFSLVNKCPRAPAPGSRLAQACSLRRCAEGALQPPFPRDPAALRAAAGSSLGWSPPGSPRAYFTTRLVTRGLAHAQPRPAGPAVCTAWCTDRSRALFSVSSPRLSWHSIPEPGKHLPLSRWPW